MDFFKVTEEDIATATKGSRATFTNNEQVKFTIKELKQKEINGEENLIISCVVTSESATSNGKDHAFFINNRPTNMKSWIKILRCFNTDEQIAKGVDPMLLIGCSFTSVAKLSAKEGKEYINFFEFKPVKDDLVGGVATVQKAFDLF